MRKPHWFLLVTLALLAPLLAACGGSSASTATTTGPTAATGSPVVTGATRTPAPTASPQSDAPRLTGDLTVYAAASLTAAFTDLGKRIEAANQGTKVAFNFAGSPTLRTQLAQGAKADLFASADEPNMQGAEQDGTIAGQPEIFAENRLVLIVPANNPAGITALQELAKPGVKLVLAQQNVPVGNYARQVLQKMAKDPSFGVGFADTALKNVVSNETDVKQVVAKVQLGEADAGIVYSTDVTPSVRPHVKVIDIPNQFNVIARYPIATVKGAGNADGAKAFIDYLVSPAGQALLATYGFLPANGSGS